MQIKPYSFLAAITLLALSFGLPYSLHIKRQLQEMGTAIGNLKALDTNASLDTSSTEVELMPKPAKRSPVITPPLSDAERLLREARERAAINPEEAMRWLQDKEASAIRLQAMLEVVATWATQDAEGTLLWLESNAQGLARIKTLQNGVTLWSEKDPIAAADWIGGMADDGSKTTAATALAANWGTSDPHGAAQWIFNMPQGPTREDASKALIDSWIITNPAEAAEWAALQSEQVGNDDALKHCIQEITKNDLDTAEKLLRLYQSAYPEALLLESYIQSRAKIDPNQTSQWLNELPEDDLLNTSRASKALLLEWTRSDSVAASTWLNKQPAGPRRDAAIEGFVESIQSYDADAATAWSNVISNPDQRIRSLALSIEYWSQNDPQAAAKWVQETNLSPELRNDLNRIIQN